MKRCINFCGCCRSQAHEIRRRVASSTRPPGAKVWLFGRYLRRLRRPPAAEVGAQMAGQSPTTAPCNHQRYVCHHHHHHQQQQQQQNGLQRANNTTSRRYAAEDVVSTELCKFSYKNVTINTLMIHVEHNLNPFSSMQVQEICFCTNLRKSPWWFILSNAFEISRAHKLAVEPLFT